MRVVRLFFASGLILALGLSGCGGKAPAPSASSSIRDQTVQAVVPAAKTQLQQNQFISQRLNQQYVGLSPEQVVKVFGQPEQVESGQNTKELRYGRKETELLIVGFWRDLPDGSPKCTALTWYPQHPMAVRELLPEKLLAKGPDYVMYDQKGHGYFIAEFGGLITNKKQVARAIFCRAPTGLIARSYDANAVEYKTKLSPQWKEGKVLGYTESGSALPGFGWLTFGTGDKFLSLEMDLNSREQLYLRR